MTQPSPDARAVVRALDALTTQVRRLADGAATPVVTPSGYHPTGVRPEPTTAPDTPSPLAADRAADDEQQLRWARRESLLVLLTRLQRGRHLTEDEARTLRHHVETEMRKADTARTEATRLGLMVDEYGKGASTLSEKLRKAQRAADLLADSHRRAEAAYRTLDTRTTELEQAQAAIERVRSLAVETARFMKDGTNDHDIGRYDTAVCVLDALREDTEPSALDGTEQPTTKD